MLGIEDILMDVKEIRSDDNLLKTINNARKKQQSVMFWQFRGSQGHATINRLMTENDIPVFNLSGRNFLNNDIDINDIIPSDNGTPGILLVDDFTWADPVVMNVFVHLAAFGKFTEWTLPAGWIFIFICNISETSYNKYDRLDFKCTSHIKNYTYCPRNPSTYDDEDVNESLNESTADDKLREIYDNLCKCQDLAESAGYLSLMYDFEDLRHRMDAIMYNGEKSLNL